MEGYILFFIPGLLFSILSIAFLSFGLVRKQRIIHFHPTEGEVIKKGTFFEHTPDYFPTVRYEVDGKVYEYQSRVSQRPGFKPGTKIGVLYHPERPEKAVINTFVQRGSAFTLIGVIIGIMALIAIVIPIIMFI